MQTNVSVPSRASRLFLAGLILSSIFVTTILLFFNYAILALNPRKSLRRRVRSLSAFKPNNILLTGISTPQGLRLARAFHSTGSNVVGAAYQPDPLPLLARCSVALSRYCRLRFQATHATSAGFSTELVKLIENQHIDLWIDCSEDTPASVLAEAKSRIEQATRCVCLVASKDQASIFETPTTFIDFARHHELPVPDSYKVQSRGEVHDILNNTRGKKRYVLDSSEPHKANIRTPLPRRTLSQTYNEVSRLKIQQGMSWMLREDLDGLARYQTFAIVIKGQLQAFAAFQTAGSGSPHLLPGSYILTKAMQHYLRSVADQLGQTFSSHFRIDFCLEERATERGVESRILPIRAQCNADKSVCFFGGIDGSLDLVRAYSQALSSSPTSNGVHSEQSSTQSQNQEHISNAVKAPVGIYSLGNDVVHLIITPLILLLTFRRIPISFVRSILELINHIVFWREEIYDFRDPLPFWYHYQIYIPLQLIRSAISGQATVTNEQLMIK